MLQDIMSEKKDSLKVKQIEVLLGVLAAGLAAGVILAVVMLYYYNPSGSYLAKNVLLDPDSAYSLRYVEPGAKAKSDNRYVFDGAYFSYYDPELNQVRPIPVDKEKYAEFYKSVANESSLVEPDSHIEALFSQPQPAVLSLKVRRVGEDASKGAESVFSRIEFAYEGDFYRIQLRHSAPGNEWAYFYHPKIYRQLMALFYL